MISKDRKVGEERIRNDKEGRNPGLIEFRDYPGQTEDIWNTFNYSVRIKQHKHLTKDKTANIYKVRYSPMY